MLRFPVLTRPTARLLVCLYVLASCRALIPGLCATQAALLDSTQESGRTSMTAAHACCSLTQPPGNTSDSAPARKTPATKCAFCELAKGFVTPSPTVTVDALAEQLDDRIGLTVRTPFTARLWDPSLARDPPTLLCA